jgi:hypothetical protein
MLGMPMPPLPGGGAAGSSMNRAIAPDMAKVCKDLRQLLAELSASQLSDGYGPQGEVAQAVGTSSSSLQVSNANGKAGGGGAVSSSGGADDLGSEMHLGPAKKQKKISPTSAKSKGGKVVIDVDAGQPEASNSGSGSGSSANVAAGSGKAASSRGARRGAASAGASSKGSKAQLIILD